MAKSVAKDRQYLEQHRGKWRVTLAVPKRLRAELGYRLKHALHTDSLAVANQMKWPVVNEMRAKLARMTNGSPDILAIADEFKRQMRNAKSDDEVEQIDAAISVTIDAMLGKEIGVEVDPTTGQENPVYTPEASARAVRFAKAARGEATPIDRFHPQYLAQLTVKPRTASDDERSLKLLMRWCADNAVEPFLQSFPNRKVASRFVDDLPKLEPGLSPVTLNKYARRLSRYWQWLEKRDEVHANVWQGLTLPVPDTPHDQKERPFTDEEVVTLLSGDATQEMQDVMRVAALTGCRLDPIVCLRVRDCRSDGVFVFKPQKKEKAARLCPIHTDLAEIVERRTRGKQPDDPIFPEWPGPQDARSRRERSFKTSNEFTDYRRSVGVMEEREGRRRSLVNFHSFRRWFITKAEQAGQPESLIAAVVGHKRQGMTLGVYSAGPLIEQARDCVEAVQLPKRSVNPLGLLP